MSEAIKQLNLAKHSARLAARELSAYPSTQGHARDVQGIAAVLADISKSLWEL